MHVITGELRKPTYIKSGVGKDGASTMYGLELSEVIKDYKTGEKSYTNYKALLFAASPAHIEYYNKTLVEGNWVSLSCEKLKIEVSECGQYTKLFMENARVDASGYIAAQTPQQQAPQQAPQQAVQQQYQAPQQQAPQQAYQAPTQQAPQQQYQAQQAPQQRPTPVPQQNVTPDLGDEWSDDIPF